MPPTVIGRERPGDAPPIDALLRAAFPTGDEAELVADLRDRARPFISIVARDGPSIVGHTALTPVVVTHPGHAPWTALALAPLCTHRDHRGRGIGASLINAAIEAARASQAMTIFVLGSPGYYHRFGFQPARPAGLTCKWIRNDGANTESFMLRPLTDRRPSAGFVAFHDAFDRFEEA